MQSNWNLLSSQKWEIFIAAALSVIDAVFKRHINQLKIKTLFHILVATSLSWHLLNVKTWRLSNIYCVIKCPTKCKIILTFHKNILKQ